MTREAMIPLYGRSGVVAHAVVDAEGEPKVASFRWHLCGGYAVRTRPRPEWPEHGQKELMHRALLELVKGDGLQGDHKDGNRLNNRRSNLRVVSLAENMQNKAAKRGTTSRYRGVMQRANKPGRWYAVVKVAGQGQKWLGHYATEAEAAAVAAAYRAEHMPYAVERAA